MTYMDWMTLAIAVYAAAISTLIGIRQQLRIRGEWELLRHRQRLRADSEEIKAGGAVYWDGNRPGRVTNRHGFDARAYPHVADAVFGVAIDDSVPIPDDPDGHHTASVAVGCPIADSYAGGYQPKTAPTDWSKIQYPTTDDECQG